LWSFKSDWLNLGIVIGLLIERQFYFSLERDKGREEEDVDQVRQTDRKTEGEIDWEIVREKEIDSQKYADKEMR